MLYRIVVRSLPVTVFSKPMVGVPDYMPAMHVVTLRENLLHFLLALFLVGFPFFLFLLGVLLGSLLRSHLSAYLVGYYLFVKIRRLIKTDAVREE